MERRYLSSGDVRGKSWDSNNFMSYTCNFCNRQFRSAQALGGHMNVHRKDRARLRLLPSSFSDCHHNLHPNSNPTNPNFTSSSPSSSSAKFLPSSSSPSSASMDEEKKLLKINLPQLDPSSPQGGNITSKKRTRGVLGFGESKGTCAQKDEAKVMKKEDTINLDLEIGLLKDPQEDLDLELRLGFFSS